MRKILIAGLGAIAVIGLSACSEKAQDKLEQAGDAVGNDLESGINHADDKVAAGADRAGQALDNAGDKIDAATDDVGASVKEGTKDARKDVGSAVENAGQDIQH